MRKEVPIWKKSNLSLDEASAYFGIGINKLREITDDENSSLVIWVGNRRLIKRLKMEKYLENTYSI